MATAAQTIEALVPVGKLAGLLPGSLERIMRALKEAEGQNLIPMSQKGGGKGRVELQPQHHTNFAIGIMAPDTIAQAAAVVPVYRALIPVQKTVTHTDYAGDEVITRSKTYRRGKPTLLSGMLPWDNPPDVDLGQTLEKILLDFDTIAAEIPILECTAWRVRPWVEITFRINHAVTETLAFGPAPDLLAALTTAPDWMRPAGTCFSMPVVFFRILAELARDSMRQGQQISSNAAGGTAAEDANTTTPAAGGTGPASVDKASQPGGNPVISAEATSQQDSDENKKGQSHRPSASHGSPSSDHPNQRKDEPPWPISNSPIQSAG
jgi:hypothetical protein